MLISWLISAANGEDDSVAKAVERAPVSTEINSAFIFFRASSVPSAFMPAITEEICPQSAESSSRRSMEYFTWYTGNPEGFNAV